MKIIITVPGTPVGKGRPRVTYHGTYTPQKTKDYEELIRECWLVQSRTKLRDDVPLKMTVGCYFPVPKSASKKAHRELIGKAHAKMPDLDNCIKSAADGLQGYAFSNDSRIASIVAYKEYSEDAHMTIEIEEIK